LLDGPDSESARPLPSLNKEGGPKAALLLASMSRAIRLGSVGEAA
jgi:hypothetical protein